MRKYTLLSVIPLVKKTVPLITLSYFIRENSYKKINGIKIIKSTNYHYAAAVMKEIRCSCFKDQSNLTNMSETKHYHSIKLK